MERPRANADTVGLTRYRAGHFRHEPEFFLELPQDASLARSILRQFQQKPISFARTVARKRAPKRPETALVRECPR